MEIVSWASNGVEYRAAKIDLYGRPSVLGAINGAVEELIRSNVLPTKVIASGIAMRAILYSALESVSGKTLRCGVHDDVEVAMQVDHRVEDVVYILFEEIDPCDLEAVEFEGLDELP